MGTSISKKYQTVKKNTDNVSDGSDGNNNRQLKTVKNTFSENEKSTIDKNAELVREKYGLNDDGMFCQSTKRAQIYKSRNPIEDSVDFYEKISTGGVKTVLDNGKGTLTRLDDGTYITHRIVTKTPDSPAVDIKVNSTSFIKTQKIHFIFEGGDAK